MLAPGLDNLSNNHGWKTPSEVQARLKLEDKPGKDLSQDGAGEIGE